MLYILVGPATKTVREHWRVHVICVRKQFECTEMGVFLLASCQVWPLRPREWAVWALERASPNTV